MADAFMIRSEAQLEALYRRPTARAAAKVRSRIDRASARFIDLCPFVVLATGHGSTADASPRGGPPGFILRLDDRHVAIPDLGGNNLLDSYRNVVASPGVGLLLMVPGRDETLRINGPGLLTTDPALLDRFTPELRRPRLALVVETEEIYGHCAKAFRRSRLWDPASWDELAAAPDLAEIYAAQAPEVDEAEMRRSLVRLYGEELAEDVPPA